MLCKSILHKRIGKWSLALIEFSLDFVPLKDIKGKIVAYFLDDHTHVEILECYLGIKPWKLYFDGSKNIDGSRIGIVIISLMYHYFLLFLSPFCIILSTD